MLIEIKPLRAFQDLVGRVIVSLYEYHGLCGLSANNCCIFCYAPLATVAMPTFLIKFQEKQGVNLIRDLRQREFQTHFSRCFLLQKIELKKFLKQKKLLSNFFSWDCPRWLQRSSRPSPFRSRVSTFIKEGDKKGPGITHPDQLLSLFSPFPSQG